jgi:hypothetical protein
LVKWATGSTNELRPTFKTVDRSILSSAETVCSSVGSNRGQPVYVDYHRAARPLSLAPHEEDVHLEGVPQLQACRKALLEPRKLLQVVGRRES